jgi:hypothetical protein
VVPESDSVIVLPDSDTADLVRPVELPVHPIVKLVMLGVEANVLEDDVISRVGLACPTVIIDVDATTGVVAFAAVAPINEIPDANSKTAVAIEKNFLSMMLSFNLWALSCSRLFW